MATANAIGSNLAGGINSGTIISGAISAWSAPNSIGLDVGATNNNWYLKGVPAEDTYLGASK